MTAQKPRWRREDRRTRVPPKPPENSDQSLSLGLLALSRPCSLGDYRLRPGPGHGVFVSHHLIERILQYFLRKKGSYAGDRPADQRTRNRHAVAHARRDTHTQLLGFPRQVHLARHDDARRWALDAQILRAH